MAQDRWKCVLGEPTLSPTGHLLPRRLDESPNKVKQVKLANLHICQSMELVVSVMCGALSGKDLPDDYYRPTDDFPRNISNNRLDHL